MNNETIFLNHIRTPDGTILISSTRHDYNTYTDANGYEYMVDGGSAYLLRNVNKEPYTELSYDFESAREHFTWGSRGLKGDQPLNLPYLKRGEHASG